ncbi:HAD-IA family hydrolase [Variovorax ureilyticus]|uniref:phosphoglycolate phosphatase n=1 Tax=Variovorax ureilyticus TaxID=1836198 RepID=A0ABU8VPU1_9BURK
MKAIRAIAFDLDGTLVDSAGGVANALNAALADATLAPFDVATVRGWIGDGPDALIARALRASDLPELRVAGLMGRVRRGFDAATLEAPFAHCSIFEGIEALLEDLAPSLPLAVVTNKPTVLARAVLEGAGLLHRFSSVHGADMATQRKPSPWLIEQAARALAAKPADMLMVGDASTDMQAALAAGCKGAWAAWGYGQPASGPAAVCWHLDTPADLIALLTSARAQCH